MDGSCWFAVETQPQSEARAQENLSRQGFESFCPRFRKIRRHARRKDVVLAPLFPGYLFVRFDRARDQWRSINGTLGVRRLVATNPYKPQPMPDGTMEFLLSRCEAGTAKLKDEPLPIGAMVRFAAGPFLDRLATVETLDATDRVRVLLEILGGQQSVVAARRELVPA